MNNNGKNDGENRADGDDAHILLKRGVIIKCYEGWKISKNII